MKSKPISYIARIPRLSEIILDGSADPDYWIKLLAHEGLQPLGSNGQLLISISATRLKWMGIPARELTISIPACSLKSREAGALLLQAYNSVPALAWMERAFFQTPYLPARIDGQYNLPASIRLVRSDQTFLEMRMKAAPALLRRESQLWEGPIFLPASQRQAGRKFFARLGGETAIYPFGGGVCEYHTGSPEPVWRHLAESGFQPLQWRIRPAAEHARSKTLNS